MLDLSRHVPAQLRLMGRYTAPFVSTLPGTATAVTKQHNLGCDYIVGQPSILLKCLVAELGFLVGYQTSNPNQNTAGGSMGQSRSGAIRGPWGSPPALLRPSAPTT